MITGFSDPAMWLKVFEPGGAVGLLKDSPMILVDLLVGGILKRIKSTSQVKRTAL